MNKPWPLTLRYIALVSLLLALVLFSIYIRELLKPLAAAAFTAYLLLPIASFVSRRLHWSKRATTNLVYFVSLALVIAVLVSLVPVLLGQAEDIQKVFTQISEDIQRLLISGIRIGPFLWHPRISLPSSSTLLTQLPTTVIENALQILESTGRGLVYILLFVVSLYYFLTHWDRMRSWLINLAPEPYEPDAQQLYGQIQGVWAGYLWGQMRLMLIVGVVYTFAWLVIGLPGALIIGPLTGLLTLIPDAGPLIATAIAVIVALLEGSLWLPISNVLFALLVIVIYVVLIAIKNVWVRPVVMGRSVEMHEGLVFVAIVGALIYGGILGALVVIPVMASLGIIGRYLRQRILGLEPFPVKEQKTPEDKPAPTPAEEIKEEA